MNPATLAKLKEPANKEIFNNKLRLMVEELRNQKESREVVTDIAKELKEKFEIDTAITRKLAKAKLDESLDELLEVNSELVSLTAVIE